MKIHEFQAKQVLSRYGVPVPRSKVAESVEEAVDAARELGGEVWVVKAQIHAGGRGKGGGVKVCRGLEEVRENAEKILGMQLVTKQTGPAGQKVLRVLIEEGMEIIKELYCSVLVDRTKQSIVMLASVKLPTALVPVTNSNLPLVPVASSVYTQLPIETPASSLII